MSIKRAHESNTHISLTQPDALQSSDTAATPSRDKSSYRARMQRRAQILERIAAQLAVNQSPAAAITAGTAMSDAHGVKFEARRNTDRSVAFNTDRHEDVASQPLYPMIDTGIHDADADADMDQFNDALRSSHASTFDAQAVFDRTDVAHDSVMVDRSNSELLLQEHPQMSTTSSSKLTHNQYQHEDQLQIQHQNQHQIQIQTQNDKVRQHHQPRPRLDSHPVSNSSKRDPIRHTRQKSIANHTPEHSLPSKQQRGNARQPVPPSATHAHVQRSINCNSAPLLSIPGAVQQTEVNITDIPIEERRHESMSENADALGKPLTLPASLYQYASIHAFATPQGDELRKLAVMQALLEAEASLKRDDETFHQRLNQITALQRNPNQQQMQVGQSMHMPNQAIGQHSHNDPVAKNEQSWYKRNA